MRIISMKGKKQQKREMDFMKKIISITVALVMALSVGFGTTYAKNDEDKQEQKDKREQIKEERQDKQEAVKDLTEQYEENIDTLKDMLKQYNKDKEKRKELLKKIHDLRKSQNNEDIPIYVGGNEVKMDVPPVIKGERTLIPVRAVTNALGADVDWISETRTVTVTKTVYGATYGASVIKIEIKIDSDTILVNGVEQKIDVPAQIVSERTMVPIRFIAEIFKKKIDWDDDSRSVLIDDEDEEEAIKTTVTPNTTNTTEIRTSGISYSFAPGNWRR